MRQSTASFFFILFITGFGFADHGKDPLYGTQYVEENPFWKKRTSLQKRIQKERLIAVSANSEPEKSEVIWSFRGAGIVNTPFEFLWNYARDFQKLAKIEDIFKRVSYSEESQRLFLNLMILGREKEMVIQFQYDEQGSAKKMHWKNIEGLYKGMEGVIVFEPTGAEKTEVSLFSGLKSEPSALPSWLITFGVEALMQRVSTTLRTNAESAYNNK